MVLVIPVGNRSPKAGLYARQVIDVNSSTPLRARGLKRSLRQAVDGSIPRGNLHSFRTYVECKASDQCHFSGEGKLRAALSECLFSPLVKCDVAGDAKQLHGSSIRPVHN